MKHYVMTAVALQLCLWLPLSYATTLIPVKPSTSKRCVEYFIINGESVCSTKPKFLTSQDDMSIQEPWDLRFDDRQWVRVFSKTEDNLITIEYVPQGDNINQWHELFTSQRIANVSDELNAQSYVDIFANRLKKRGYQLKVTTHEKKADEVIWEFQVLSQDEQDEIQRVVFKNNNLYILHYVTKQRDMGPANRAKWLKLLKMAKLRQ